MKNWIITFLIFTPVFAGAQVLTLDEAIKIALENNFDVVTASQSKEVARLQNHVGNAGMLPTISVNGNASYGLNALRQEFSSGLSVNNPSVNNRVFGAQAALDWVVFDGLRMFAIKKRLSLQYDIADLTLKDQIINTVTQVIQTYTTFAAETERLEALETTVAYFDELAKNII
jgi:outer membrane protein